MKLPLKVLAGIAGIAILGLGTSFILFLRNEPPCRGTLTLDGDINSYSFIESRDCLVRSRASKKTFVVKASGGGNGPAALAIGMLIRKHNWDVEVDGICASSCAIFIFPAGKTKYLGANSLLLFHGGPYQENLTEMAAEIDRKLAAGATAEPITLGQATREGTYNYSPVRTPADQEVLEFLSMTHIDTASEKLAAMRNASDRFYQELGVNPLLSTYGQIGAYEPMYKSYEHGGFVYSLDSLRRLGIDNIELKDGEWHPERHPDYQFVYEVTYP